MKSVLVLCGGKSAEAGVSLVSARTVVDNLDPARYRVTLGWISPKGRWFRAQARRLPGRVPSRLPDLATGSKELGPLDRLGVDVVFSVIHGSFGEDGTLQGFLEASGLPYVGCGVLGSAVGMDKGITKLLAVQAGLPILPYRVARSLAEARGALKSLGLPLFVKPARLGSSVGISKVKKASELAAAFEEARAYDDKVVLEKGLEAAREIEVAVLGDPWAEKAGDPLTLKASGCGEIVPNAEFYTYQSKYLDEDGARLLIPAPIPKSLERKIRDMALRAFRVLDGYGMGRADFLVDKRTGKPYFNEINTIPGFTSASMYPLLWKAAGVDLPALLEVLIALAERRRREVSRLKIAPCLTLK